MYENIDKSIYTPMMKQYLDIKENYKDTLLFYRIGDFYEMFFNDALVASKELEIVLTGRDAGAKEKVPMCGVPHHAVDGYIEKLSQKGYKVAIVEQLEEASNKKLVHRDVIRIITPGTNIDESYLSDKTNNYIGSIDKLPSCYVLAYVELSTGECKLTSLPLNIDLLIGEINKLKIKEIVVSSTFNTQICESLKRISGVLISPYDNLNIDNYMNNILDNVLSVYQNTCKRILSYIIETQKRVLVHIQPFIYYDVKSYLRIDNTAVKNLELIESMSGNRFKNNLFQVLDKCQTAMGSRFLKRSILFPLVDLRKINYRLDFIDELHKNYLSSEKIKEFLSEIYDLERIIGRISFGNPSPRDLLQLRKSLKVLPSLKDTLSKMKGKVCKEFSGNINCFEELYNILVKALYDNPAYSVKDGGVINEGYSKELDEIRNIELTNKDFLNNLELRERERTGIKSLKVGYNRIFGYFIEITKANISLVKDEFGYIRKQTTSNSERFITQELKERETLILRSNETALNLEKELFNDLKDKCKNLTSSLQELANHLSHIDMLLALSIVAKDNNYVRPTFSPYSEMIIEAGRHPVIETFSNKEFIPNDLVMYNDDKILLITGPNMGGKSTYMRQSAIISVMAQMGSFVPASKALVPIFDQIFTRIGSSDDITSGESTFMTEMLEVNNALSNATERSLIILDEVGRGTATFDGMALAQSIVEYLHDEIGAKTFFSTHYHELTSLEDSLPYLKNVHVEASTKEDNNRFEIVFLHKVLDGATDESYGINVAYLAGINQKITYRAKDILSKLEKKNTVDTKILSKDNYTEPIIINNVNSSEQKVIDGIRDCDIDNMSPLQALLLVKDLKEKLD